MPDDSLCLDEFVEGLRRAELALERGWRGRDYQSAIWVGAEIVASPEAFRQVFMNGIYRVSKDLGIAPETAMRHFWRGDIHINHIIGQDAAVDLRFRAARVLAKLTDPSEYDDDMLGLIGLGGMQSGESGGR